MEHAIQSLIIVEDEPLVSMMIAEQAEDIGWQVVGSAHTEIDAFALLDQCQPSVALLDINLGLTTSLAIASSCRDRGIQVIFITGFTARDIPSQCGDTPVLAKPFSIEDLELSLRRAVNKRESTQRVLSRSDGSTEIAVTCPACGKMNTLVHNLRIVKQKVNCSKCGEQLGALSELGRSGGSTQLSAAK